MTPQGPHALQGYPKVSHLGSRDSWNPRSTSRPPGIPLGSLEAPTPLPGMALGPRSPTLASRDSLESLEPQSCFQGNPRIPGISHLPPGTTPPQNLRSPTRPLEPFRTTLGPLHALPRSSRLLGGGPPRTGGGSRAPLAEHECAMPRRPHRLCSSSLSRPALPGVPRGREAQGREKFLHSLLGRPACSPPPCARAPCAKHTGNSRGLSEDAQPGAIASPEIDVIARVSGWLRDNAAPRSLRLLETYSIPVILLPCPREGLKFGLAKKQSLH